MSDQPHTTIGYGIVAGFELLATMIRASEAEAKMAYIASVTDFKLEPGTDPGQPANARLIDTMWEQVAADWLVRCVPVLIQEDLDDGQD